MTSRLPDNFPDCCTFIIDGLSSAYLTAVLCRGHSIKCIYECKEVEWRQVDFMALYDLLLSDVNVIEKTIVNVPHPYFLQGKDILETIRNQKKFKKEIRDIIKLKKGEVFCSCITSSILLGNKEQVRYVLLDEGMDSIMSRHRLYSRDKSQIIDKFKSLLGSKIIPFRFDARAPQVTLANDTHSSIVAHKDYRDFTSNKFERLITPLLEKLKVSEVNILALVKGPSHVTSGIISTNKENYGKYINFNLRMIKQFIKKFRLPSSANFFLKTHPSMGICPVFIDELISTLKEHSIDAQNLFDGLVFEELPSIPAEAYLAYGNFKYALSLDASSTMWNVAHKQEVKCFMPLNSIIQFAKEEDIEFMTPLFSAQTALNELNGNFVIFY